MVIQVRVGKVLSLQEVGFCSCCKHTWCIPPQNPWYPCPCWANKKKCIFMKSSMYLMFGWQEYLAKWIQLRTLLVTAARMNNARCQDWGLFFGPPKPLFYGPSYNPHCAWWRKDSFRGIRFLRQRELMRKSIRFNIIGTRNVSIRKIDMQKTTTNELGKNLISWSPEYRPGSCGPTSLSDIKLNLVWL